METITAKSNEAGTEFQTLESVQNYYGKVLSSTADLQTSACCTAESMPEYLKPLVREIHPEVLDKFYGCGSPLPAQLEGRTVLDLGSGSGRDVFMLSKLVGENGRVIGIDMTDEQLSTARKFVGYHADKFGYKKTNVEFHRGYIEDLKSLGIQDNSVDVITSNCVINLSPDKRRVFSEAFRVLKPGGEMYFSDVFATRRIPKDLREDPVLLGECLGGALYTEDFRRMLNDIGCRDFRVMNKTKISITNPEITHKVGGIEFYSITIRAFKIDLEDRCEDYGQVAYYQGGIRNQPTVFRLDDHHTFEVGKPLTVCSNTARMLQKSRFSSFFKIVGTEDQHFGLFDCGPTPVGAVDANVGACC